MGQGAVASAAASSFQMGLLARLFAVITFFAKFSSVCG
jgi:hypothetical protein